MRVLIVPDSFKGSIDADGASTALAEGWGSVRPHDELLLRPMADGGEGSLAAVAAATPGTAVIEFPGCTGPDARHVTGRYALLQDGTAFVELATASGLPLMSAGLSPLTATTRGTGETIAAALDRGARRVIVALGGSAATDAGSGLLAALGLRLTDAAGTCIADGGGALSLARQADTSRLRPPPPGGVLALTDVTNPLLGPTGAAAVYGPQKGATPAQVGRLEQGLTRLAELLGGTPALPGSGAAGGTAYGLCSAWNAHIVPGARTIADLLRLDEAIASADLVLTGEGRFDATSLLGKTVGEILQRTGRHQTPVTVIAGSSTDPPAHGADLISLSELAGTTVGARTDPARWLRAAARTLALRLDRLPESGTA